MSISLVLKELRETAWMAAIALVVNLSMTIGFTGALTHHQPFWTHTLNIAATIDFTLVGMCLAVALGLRQTVGERAYETFQFLAYRPPGLRGLIGVKLLVGMGLYLIVTATPLILCVWWAVTPGTNDAPFRWAMTRLAWQGWWAGGILYLGAFLAGLRPARWFGTRLFPLIAAVGLAGFFTFFSWCWWVGTLAVVLLDALLVATIFFVAETRDFS